MDQWDKFAESIGGTVIENTKTEPDYDAIAIGLGGTSITTEKVDYDKFVADLGGNPVEPVTSEIKVTPKIVYPGWKEDEAEAMQILFGDTSSRTTSIKTQPEPEIDKFLVEPSIAETIKLKPTAEEIFGEWKGKKFETENEKFKSEHPFTSQTIAGISDIYSNWLKTPEGQDTPLSSISKEFSMEKPKSFSQLAVRLGTNIGAVLPQFLLMDKTLAGLGLSGIAQSMGTWGLVNALQATIEGKPFGEILDEFSTGALSGAIFRGIDKVMPNSPLGIIEGSIMKGATLTGVQAISEERLPTTKDLIVNTALLVGFDSPRLLNALSKRAFQKPIKNLLKQTTNDFQDLAKENPEFIKKLHEAGKNMLNISSEIKPSDDPVRAIIDALKEAEPLRGKQEQIYSKIRGQRLAKAQAVGKKITGEKGFYAELGQLKGEMPKIQFESIRNKFKQENIDALFRMVKDSSKISAWEKVPARKGLAKLFGEYGGHVPQPNELSLLNRIFGEEFTKTVLSKRPILGKIKEAGFELMNMPRAIMASYDLSFGFRQGIFLAPRYPRMFFKSFIEQFKYFGSEKAYNSLEETIRKHPNYDLAKESGLSLTEMGKGLKGREERFMSPWAEKIPLVGRGVKASARAYTGMANKLRFDVFNYLVDSAEKLGRNPKENIELTKQIAKFVNCGTGRGNLGGLEGSAVLINSVFFSPRLMSSRLTLLNPAYYIKADPFVRKEALKSLFTFIGTGTTMLGLAKSAGAEVVTDPRNSDFGKIKIGNTRIDIWGGFQQYVRSVSQAVSGKYVSSTTGKEFTLGEGYKPLTRYDILIRQLESKEAPIFSLATTLLRGKTYPGEDVILLKEIEIRFIPMVIQDLYDISQDDPNLLPLIIPAAFGVGVQTYSRGKMGTLFEGTGETYKSR